MEIRVELPFKVAEKMYKTNDPEMKSFALSAFPALGKSKIERIEDLIPGVTPMEAVFVIANVDPKNYESTSEEDVAPIALKKLRLAQSLVVEGWKPDYGNTNQKKYYPWFKWSASSRRFACDDYFCELEDTVVGSRLVFPTSEMAVWFGKTFETEYNELFN